MADCRREHTTLGVSVYVGSGGIFMDQTFDKDDIQGGNASEQGGPGQGTAQSDTTGSGGDLLSFLPLPSTCTEVLRKLRAPAISIRYSLNKQIIPNLDTAQSQTSGNNSGTANTSSESAQSGGSAGDTASNTMSESGSFTVRFFDVAVGGMLVAVGICMLKCCCGMKRMCRHWL